MSYPMWGMNCEQQLLTSLMLFLKSLPAWEKIYAKVQLSNANKLLVYFTFLSPTVHNLLPFTLCLALGFMTLVRVSRALELIQEAGKMGSWEVKVQPEFSPQNPHKWKVRTNSSRLSSDLHMCTLWHVCMHTQAHSCAHTPTHKHKLNK